MRRAPRISSSSRSWLLAPSVTMPCMSCCSCPAPRVQHQQQEGLIDASTHTHTHTYVDASIHPTPHAIGQLHGRENKRGAPRPPPCITIDSVLCKQSRESNAQTALCPRGSSRLPPLVTTPYSSPTALPAALPATLRTQSSLCVLPSLVFGASPSYRYQPAALFMSLSLSCRATFSPSTAC